MGNSHDDAAIVELKAIKFVFHDEKVGDSLAIPLFRPSSPEFPAVTAAKVAYPKEELPQDGEVTIMCCFKSKTVNGNVFVRAIAIGGDFAEVVKPSKFNIGVEPFFSALGTEDGTWRAFIPLKLQTSAIFKDDAVGEYAMNLCWQWTASDPNSPDFSGPWQNIGTYPFQFCQTLASPKPPWGGLKTSGLQIDPENPQFSFHSISVFLFNHAIRWAKGAKDVQSVASQITQNLLHETQLSYDYGSMYCSLGLENGLPDGKTASIDVSALAERLRGMYGNGPKVNCTDLSHITMLLGNALGTNLRIGTLLGADKKKGFQSNPLCLIGSLQSDPRSYGFVYHQVAYLDSAGQALGFGEDPTVLIYDPCLTLIDENGQKLEVLGIPLSRYLALLAPANQCIPQESPLFEVVTIV